MLFHEQQFLALMNGDAELERYEILIHMASEKRQAAKYGYMAHIEAHGCEAPAQAALAEFVVARENRGARLGRRTDRSNRKVLAEGHRVPASA
jgi:hypothetical protein